MNLTEVQISAIFREFRRDVLEFRDEALKSAGQILEQESRLSVRQRFYRTGAALRSVEHRTTEEGERKTYEQFSELFYFRFGEYGTGRRGRLSNVPHPASYQYGDRPGMTARFMLGTALRIAKPRILRQFRIFTNKFVKKAA